MVGGGGLSAEGPNGERVGLGLLIQGIHDPGANTGFMRGGVACPRGNLFNVYVCAVNQQRQSQGLPPASFTLTNSTQLPGNAVQVIFDLDLHDGKGLRNASARLGALASPGLPRLGADAFQFQRAPKASPPPKRRPCGPSSPATARIPGSSNEVQQQLNRIHAIGQRSKIQAQEADQRREASASAFDAHMDNIRPAEAKAFQNYTLDRSQIQDQPQPERPRHSVQRHGQRDGADRPQPLSGGAARRSS